MKETLLSALQAAGNLIKEKWNSNWAVNHKEGINNLVTAVDLEAEQLITAIIRKQFPEHGFLGEEYGAESQEAEYLWIIDPIDGTVNFAHGVPLCCVSIALAKNKEVILGGIYNPMMNELFFAEKGKGAFLNDTPIHVSQKAELEKAFLVTGFPYNFSAENDPLVLFQHFIKMGLPIRRLGSAALDLCWVACGRFDGFWEYNLQAWDIAAGYLIVQEAGGIVTDFNNQQGHYLHKQTLATNSNLHQALLSEIQHTLNNR